MGITYGFIRFTNSCLDSDFIYNLCPFVCLRTLHCNLYLSPSILDKYLFSCNVNDSVQIYKP